MKYIMSIMLLFTLVGCGNEANLTFKNKSKLSSSILMAEGYPMVITVPAGGAPVTLAYSGNVYRVGSMTPQAVQDYILNLPEGTIVTKTIIGEFSFENDHDVINIVLIK